MSTNADFADCQDCLCLAARKQGQRLTRQYDEKLRPFELTINQFSMLTHLILGGPATMSTLAERLGVERTTLSRNAALCGERGWVKVEPGEDARERLVTLTAAGREKAEVALPAWRAAQAWAITDT
jgi:DNA-binding MarR family transcriptional regulator